MCSSCSFMKTKMWMFLPCSSESLPVLYMTAAGVRGKMPLWEEWRIGSWTKHQSYSIAKLLQSSPRTAFIRGFHIVPLQAEEKKKLHKMHGTFHSKFLIEAIFVCVFCYTPLWAFCQDRQVIHKNSLLIKGSFLFSKVYSNFITFKHTALKLPLQF